MNVNVKMLVLVNVLVLVPVNDYCFKSGTFLVRTDTIRVDKRFPLS